MSAPFKSGFSFDKVRGIGLIETCPARTGFFVAPNGLMVVSKGSQIVPVRLPAELLALLDAAVARSVDTRKDGPWTRSSFIVKAIEEKLNKMARSAGKKQSPLPPTYHRDSATF
jgi:hypothetical protein